MPQDINTVGVIGGVAQLGVALSSDEIQGTETVIKIKQASKTWSTKIVNQIKTGKIGKTVSSGVKYAKDVGKNVGKAISSTKAGAKVGTAVGKVGTTVGKVGAAVGKAGAIVGPALGPAGDIVAGAMAISSSVERGGSDAQKAYNITGDVVGMGLNMAPSLIGALATGPFVIVLMVFQACGAILDAAWDPFKNYFNADLETMRLGIMDSLKIAYKEANMNYPIETKPDILKNLNDEKSQDYLDFKNYMQKYLDDRGFITSEEVIAEEEYVLNLKRLKRQRKLYRYDEDGNLEMMDPDMASVALLDSAANNDLIMMALAAKYSMTKKPRTEPPKLNSYYIMILILFFIFAIFFFSSILIVSI